MLGARGRPLAGTPTAITAEVANVTASMPSASLGLYRGGERGAGDVAEDLRGLAWSTFDRQADDQPVAG